MQIPQKIGWRRLFLTGSQKFLLDLHRLGSKNKPDKIEQFIIFLEGLTPVALYYKLKKYGGRLLINVYWHLMPKRLNIYKTKNPFIKEYLPWFKENGRKCNLYRSTFSGKILIESAYVIDYWTYSWKKAYFKVLEYKKEVRQQELQYKLEYELSRLEENKNGIER